MNWGSIGAIIGIAGLAFGVGTFVSESGTSLGDLNRALDNLNAKVLELEAEALAIPVGMVVSFNRDKCPSGGWKTYDHASGRFILGAGKASGLQERTYTSTGGLESITLKTSHIPPHKHSGKSGYGHNSRSKRASVDLGSDKVYDDLHGYVDNKSSGHNHEFTTDRDGGDGKAHDNMPPFIVLRYCEKI